MNALILAGGLGTRIGEETQDKPKPMITIGGFTLLEHIMENLALGGIEKFYIATGYKGEVIEKYFSKYTKFLVKPINTGESTQTGGRIKRILSLVDDEELLVTYGDGLANINAKNLIAFHKEHGKMATVTAVRPPARFGHLQINPNDFAVTRFGEKIQSDEGWINGGFFILNRTISQLIADDSTVFEKDPINALVEHGNLKAYLHTGFWAPVDTLREKNELESLWINGQALWKINSSTATS